MTRFSLWFLTACWAVLGGACASAPAPLATAPSGPAATPHEEWDWASASAGRPSQAGDGLWTGIFNEVSPLELSGVNKLESDLGKKFASIMWFQDWSTGFATDKAAAAWNAGYLPHVTWEPWFFGDQKKITLGAILDGAWDQYIIQWGREVAAFGKPVLVRWGHEFNGNWYPWSVAVNGESPDTYVRAYRRVHNLVTSAGAQNVLWAWCPNAESVPAKDWNRATLSYPGDAYVDWIGIDGYDFDGNDTFTAKFSRLYTDLTKAYNKPLFIGEMSTGRKGADRAAWLEAMNASLAKDFPGIKGIVWFNINKERDWRLEESPESLKAAAKVFSSDRYHSRPDAVPALAQIHNRDHQKYVAGAAKASEVARLRVEVKKNSQEGARIAVSDKSGVDGTIQLSWDDQALLLVAEIKDSTPLKNPQSADGIWNGDNIELCLSTDPKADPNRGFFTSTDWQFGFSTGDPSKNHAPRSWEWSKLKAPVPGAVVKASATAEGYRLEVTLPWSAMQGFRPQAGMVLGFDLALDNGGAEGTRIGQWIWNGNSSFYNNPTQWGTLALVE